MLSHLNLGLNEVNLVTWLFRITELTLYKKYTKIKCKQVGLSYVWTWHKLWSKKNCFIYYIFILLLDASFLDFEHKG